MKAKPVALWGMMGALVIAVSFIEGLFELPFIPGMKIGISNVVTVAAAMLGGVWGMLYIVAVKALFALASRGFTAFLLSITGGLLSGFVTVLLLKMRKKPFSLVGVSVIGALFHNGGQLLMATLLTGTAALLYYSPVLLGFSLVFGTATGIVLRVLEPNLKKIKEKRK